MNSLADFPAPLAAYLRKFARAQRRRLLLAALGWSAAFFLFWAAICCAADRLLQLSTTLRAALLLIAFFGVIFILLRAVLKSRTPANWTVVAEGIEQLEPRFQQELVTVVSRLAGSKDHRGSDEILAHLLRSVEFTIAASPGPPRGTIRRIATPWMICAMVLIGAVCLLERPGLCLPSLLERFSFPLADVPPVTTTQIAVVGANGDIVQSQPLRIDAMVSHLTGDAVSLFLNTGDEWSRVTMTADRPDIYSFTLASVDRDVRYYVAAGDARTAERLVRVLRRPSVDSWQVSYIFPPYAHRAPLTVKDPASPVIEAPIDTEATLLIHSTEPLQSAMLGLGDEKILMSQAGDASSRVATFRVRRDGLCDLDLISNRQVAGSGPSGLMVRALADHPPLARLTEAGQTLRLAPRDVVTLGYEAADDYALAALALQVQVNGNPPIDLPIPLAADARVQSGTVDLDVGRFDVRIGDKATVWIVATDSGAQVTMSEPLRVLLSPRSIDLDEKERLSEAETAVEFATRLSDEFAGAQSALAGDAAAASHVNLLLSRASESATLLRQALCRALLHSHDAGPDGLAVALESWIDAAQLEAHAADEMFQRRGGPASSDRSIDVELQQATNDSKQLQSEVRHFAQSLQAAAILAELDDLLPPQRETAGAGGSASNGFRRFNAPLGSLSIDPGAPDLAAQLQAKIDAGNALFLSKHPVDFSTAARQWADGVQRGAPSGAGLDQRLDVAAEAEAVRPGGDLPRARDLRLAARAVALVDWEIAQKKQNSAAADPLSFQAKTIADAMTVLQWTWSNPSGGNPSQAIAAERVAAARLKLANLLNESHHDAEDLALSASAAAAERQYAQAERLDQELARRLAETPAVPGIDPAVTRNLDAGQSTQQHEVKVAAAMSAARTIDGINQTQNAVARATQSASGGPVDQLAGQERNVVAAISAVVTGQSDSLAPSSRERVVTALLAAQESLAGWPQKLANLQSAAAAQLAAVARAAGAHAAMNALPPDVPDEQRDMARIAADEADEDSHDAADHLAAALVPVSPQSASALAGQLAPFVPESSGPVHAIQTRLVPALTELAAAARKDDAAATDQAAAAVRAAIEAVQQELVLAQESLTDRDPLAAARSFAGAAADSLNRNPPDVRTAVTRQVQATGALARAWDQTIHDAAARRFSIVPAFQPVYGPPSPIPGAEAPGGWAQIDSSADGPLNLAIHDSDPAGYEEPLRMYFEALGKAQAARPK
jgi:hypothetical protein